MQRAKSFFAAAIFMSLWASGAANAETGYLYETFAGHEITALSLTGGASFDFFGNATNVVAGGGKVYWQDDLRIFMANPDLTGASVFHINGTAPTGLGLDAKDGFLYETFAGHEITALSLTGGASFDFFGNATNVVAGGGKVYWQDDLRIFVANPDLTGVSVFHINGTAPTGLGLDAKDGFLYETFAGHEITALSLTGGASFDFFGNATNVVAGGGKVYWQDDLRIFVANPDLTGASVFHINGTAPTGLGLYVFPASPGPVPGQGLLGLAFLALAAFWARSQPGRPD